MCLVDVGVMGAKQESHHGSVCRVLTTWWPLLGASTPIHWPCSSEEGGIVSRSHSW